MKVSKAILESVREPENGKHVLLIAAYIWGKGATVAEAYANLRKQGYRAADLAIAFHVHPETCVDSIGMIMSPPGTPPQKIALVNKPVGNGRCVANEVF